jgi:protein TonB
MPAEPPALPPLPRPGAGDEVSAGQRRAVIVAIAALHGLVGWAALQVPAVRSALTEAAPMFVDLIAPPAPKPPEPPPPPPPKPIPKVPPPPAPLITAAPTPAPAPFVAPAPPPEVPPPEPPMAVVEAPPAPPAPPPPPKEIPASAIEYLVPPAPEYPRASRRLNESGLVIVRVYVDEGGVPRSAQVAKSSGFARLDDAAVSAVQKARFKPYTEAGKPTAGWARIPFPFELEK